MKIVPNTRQPRIGFKFQSLNYTYLITGEAGDHWFLSSEMKKEYKYICDPLEHITKVSLEYELKEESEFNYL